MPYHIDEILSASNPYQLLGNKQALKDNKGVLDTLSTDNKRILAKNMAVNCPVEGLHQFNAMITDISISNDENSFYHYLSAVCSLKEILISKPTPENRNPFSALLDLNAGLIANYESFIKEHLIEREVVHTFALETPVELRSKVARDISILFPVNKYNLSTKLQTAFELLRAFEQADNSNKLAVFFQNKAYTDSILAFSDLIEAKLYDREVEIGLKFAALKPEVRGNINRTFELIQPKAYDKESCFRKISEIMMRESSNLESVSLSSSSSAPPSPPKRSNSNSFFEQQQRGISISEPYLCPCSIL